MKKALPPHGKLSKESKVCIQECVSEFISFVTSQAVDRVKLEKRRTLNGEDILWSMFTLGFENYSETLKIYLAKFREFEQLEAEKRPPRKRRRTKAKPPSDYDSEDYYSEDISPDTSDAQALSREITAENNQLNNEMINPQETQIDFTFNDSNFTSLNLAQNQPATANNYIVNGTERFPNPPQNMTSSSSSNNNSNNNSRQEKMDLQVPSFDEFIERM